MMRYDVIIHHHDVSIRNCDVVTFIRLSLPGNYSYVMMTSSFIMSKTPFLRKVLFIDGGICSRGRTASDDSDSSSKLFRFGSDYGTQIRLLSPFPQKGKRSPIPNDSRKITEEGTSISLFFDMFDRLLKFFRTIEEFCSGSSNQQRWNGFVKMCSLRSCLCAKICLLM